MHATVDARGRPTGVHLTGGQAHDLHGADALLPGNAGRTLIADKSYNVDARVVLPALAAGKRVVIPPRRDRSVNLPCDMELYKLRHRIENFFARLKQYRAIATRYDKTARNFLGAVQLACAVDWLG